MIEEKRDCGSCEFFVPHDDPAVGICKRYPPGLENNRPSMVTNDWCGEFVPSKQIKRGKE